MPPSVHPLSWINFMEESGSRWHRTITRSPRGPVKSLDEISNVFSYTVEPLISSRSRDSISTVLCHSIPFEGPNKQGGATVEIESRDRGDMREPTVIRFYYQSFFIIRKNLFTPHVVFESSLSTHQTLPCFSCCLCWFVPKISHTSYNTLCSSMTKATFFPQRIAFLCGINCKMFITIKKSLDLFFGPIKRLRAVAGTRMGVKKYFLRQVSATISNLPQEWSKSNDCHHFLCHFTSTEWVRNSMRFSLDQLTACESGARDPSWKLIEDEEPNTKSGIPLRKMVETAPNAWIINEEHAVTLHHFGASICTGTEHNQNTKHDYQYKKMHCYVLCWILGHGTEWESDTIRQCAVRMSQRFRQSDAIIRTHFFMRPKTWTPEEKQSVEWSGLA